MLLISRVHVIRCSIDLLELTRDATHNFTMPLMDKHHHVENEDCTIHFALCITATKVEEDEERVEEAQCRKVARNYVSVISFECVD